MNKANWRKSMAEKAGQVWVVWTSKGKGWVMVSCHNSKGEAEEQSGNGSEVHQAGKRPAGV